MTHAEIVELLADCEVTSALTQWEDEFTSDLRDRIAEHGEATTISERQMSVLMRIRERVQR